MQGGDGMSETQDIVERLRWSGQDVMTKHVSLGMAGLHADAIAEITRLRSELKEAVNALDMATLYLATIAQMHTVDGGPDEQLRRCLDEAQTGYKDIKERARAFLQKHKGE